MNPRLAPLLPPTAQPTPDDANGDSRQKLIVAAFFLLFSSFHKLLPHSAALFTNTCTHSCKLRFLPLRNFFASFLLYLFLCWPASIVNFTNRFYFAFQTQ
uniref:(northern house mosquito) hypothetical protein n=1 Tax=Culex pipiens TaxID=7175 RepID=A0A8D8BNC9_CULPI